MPRHLTAATIAVVATVTFVVSVLLLLVPYRDWGQCDRKCRWVVLGRLGLDDPTVTGTRVGDDECVCHHAQKHDSKQIVKRKYDEFPAGFPYLWKDLRVCGVDGVTYDNAEMARKNGTKIINCHVCGSCSTVRDVSLYRKFAKPMTKMLSQCAIVYLFAGEMAARKCLGYLFQGDAGETLTPQCMNRFIDNFGCTISHCYKECLFKMDNPLVSASANMNNELSHSGANDGTKLTPCFLCDEMYCSPVFVQSGGANRRCSGTITDVSRPGPEVCSHVDAV